MQCRRARDNYRIARDDEGERDKVEGEIKVCSTLHRGNVLSLPATFSPAEVHQRYPYVPLNTVQKKLQRWAKNGVLTVVEYGLYRKAG